MRGDTDQEEYVACGIDLQCESEVQVLPALVVQASTVD